MAQRTAFGPPGSAADPFLLQVDWEWLARAQAQPPSGDDGGGRGGAAAAHLPRLQPVLPQAALGHAEGAGSVPLVALHDGFTPVSPSPLGTGPPTALVLQVVRVDDVALPAEERLRAMLPPDHVDFRGPSRGAVARRDGGSGHRRPPGEDDTDGDDAENDGGGPRKAGGRGSGGVRLQRGKVRLMRLVLSDGFRRVVGIECPAPPSPSSSPTAAASVVGPAAPPPHRVAGACAPLDRVTLGCKVELRVPLVVRHGVVLLHAESIVQVLGGFVPAIQWHWECFAAQRLSQLAGRRHAPPATAAPPSPSLPTTTAPPTTDTTPTTTTTTTTTTTSSTAPPHPAAQPLPTVVAPAPVQSVSVSGEVVEVCSELTVTPAGGYSLVVRLDVSGAAESEAALWRHWQSRGWVVPAASAEPHFTVTADLGHTWIQDALNGLHPDDFQRMARTDGVAESVLQPLLERVGERLERFGRARFVLCEEDAARGLVMIAATAL